ncbi:MAG TPA: TonB-dependent receptor, partial [Calditrichaeota bacterium]|nr:TonB-dependent receptor [Calditrichota bacterium]
MKSVILILTLFFCIRTLLSAENGVISGKLYNEQTNKPVAYANLIVKDSYLGASSDESGTFTIQLPAGKYILQIYHVVYYPKEIPVTVTPGQKVCLSIALEEKTEQLGVITVQAERNAAPSHFALKPYSVINAPAVGEPDVVRVAAMLPGIMQNNDYRAELNIRGGHADQTQFLLDGIEVFHPQHLQGMFGAFNLWAMENIDIYTARFPAEYAGRLSGIIALESKRPTKEAYTKANLSLLSMGLALTRQWGNTSLLFAARRTYLDLIARMLNSKISYNSTINLFYWCNFCCCSCKKCFICYIYLISCYSS